MPSMRMTAVLLIGLLVGSCSGAGHIIGDNLPVWAGGLPEGTPPRPGSPGYDDYRNAIRRGAAPNPGVAPAAKTTPPRPNDSLDPIH